MEMKAIEEKEQERIDAIRDENLCLKVSPSNAERVSPGGFSTPVKSPSKSPMKSLIKSSVKSPITMKVIMTPKKPMASPSVSIPDVPPASTSISTPVTILKSPVSKPLSPTVNIPTSFVTSTPPKSPVPPPAPPEHSTPAPSSPFSHSVVPVTSKLPTPSTPPKHPTPIKSSTPPKYPTPVPTSTPSKNPTPVPTSTPSKNPTPVHTSTPVSSNMVSISTTPIHNKSAGTSSSGNRSLKETEISQARTSYEDKIQSKTQELLQRVEDMKKRNEASKRRKEEKLQQSFINTPSKLDTSFHLTHLGTTPHLSVASRVLTDLAALTAVKEPTTEVDLNMPVLAVNELSTERSFVSIVSSPAAKKRKLMKGTLSSPSVLPASHPPIPPATSIPAPSQSSSSIVHSASEVLTQSSTQPSVQSSTQPSAQPSAQPSTQPSTQPSAQLPVQTSSQQPSTAPSAQPPALEVESKQRTIPMGPRRVPVVQNQLPVSVKREAEPESESSSTKNPPVELPRLPSNRPPARKLQHSISTNNQKPRNLEVLHRQVLLEREDPNKHWYEEENLNILVRRQYYESLCSV